MQTKFKLILIFHILVFLSLLVFNFSVASFICTLLFARFVGIVGVDIALHRLWTHRSFKCNPVFEKFLMIIAALNHQGSSIMFSGVHRLHHRYSDTAKDPHYGTWLQILFYTRPPGFTVPIGSVGDLARIYIHRFFHRHYFHFQYLLIALVLFGCLNSYWIIVYLISGVITINWLSAGIINIASHRWGTQKYQTNDNSRNSVLMQWWSWGEGLHNNHHHRPGNYSYRLNLGGFDICEWIIKFLEKLKLVIIPKQ